MLGAGRLAVLITVLPSINCKSASDCVKQILGTGTGNLLKYCIQYYV